MKLPTVEELETQYFSDGLPPCEANTFKGDYIMHCPRDADEVDEVVCRNPACPKTRCMWLCDECYALMIGDGGTSQVWFWYCTEKCYWEVHK